VFEGFAVKALGRIAVGQQRPDASVDAQRPRGGSRLRAQRHPVACGDKEFNIAGARRGLDQLRDDKRPHSDVVMIEDRLDGSQRIGVTAESVGEHRPPVSGEIGHLALTPGLGSRGGLLDQCTRRVPLATPRGEQQSAEPQRRVARRGRGRAILVDHRGRLLEFPTQQQRPGKVVQRELQMNRGAGGSVELRLAQRQRIPGLGVPHFGGQGGAHLGARDGQPAIGLAGNDIRGE
jgi:hypothetical protein